eukprot:scaffold3373_cov137-Cylindrotheca_fusiformis.AAC.22
MPTTLTSAQRFPLVTAGWSGSSPVCDGLNLPCDSNPFVRKTRHLKGTPSFAKIVNDGRQDVGP